jgi:hypothetical protein
MKFNELQRCGISCRKDCSRRIEAPVDGKVRIVEPDGSLVIGRVVVGALIQQIRARLPRYEAMQKTHRHVEEATVFG